MREFWIDMYSWTAHREEKEVRPGNRTCHVREVSPELDAAYEDCVKAVETYLISRRVVEKELDWDLFERAENAIDALKKAKKDEI